MLIVSEKQDVNSNQTHTNTYTAHTSIILETLMTKRFPPLEEVEN